MSATFYISLSKSRVYFKVIWDESEREDLCSQKPGKNKETELGDFVLTYYGLGALNRCFCWIWRSDWKLCHSHLGPSCCFAKWNSLLIFINVFVLQCSGKQWLACPIDHAFPAGRSSWLREAFYDCLLCGLSWFLSARVCQFPAAGVRLIWNNLFMQDNAP